MRPPGPALTRCLRPPLQKVHGGSSSLSFPPAREHHACRRQQLLEASCLHFPARVSGRTQHPRGEGTQPRKSLTAPHTPPPQLCGLSFAPGPGGAPSAASGLADPRSGPHSEHLWAPRRCLPTPHTRPPASTCLRRPLPAPPRGLLLPAKRLPPPLAAGGRQARSPGRFTGGVKSYLRRCQAGAAAKWGLRGGPAAPGGSGRLGDGLLRATAAAFQPVSGAD